MCVIPLLTNLFFTACTEHFFSSMLIDELSWEWHTSVLRRCPAVSIRGPSECKHGFHIFFLKSFFLIMCTCAERECVCTHKDVEARGGHIFLNCFSTLCFEKGSIAEPGAHWWLRHLSVYTSFSPGVTSPDCLHRCWGSELTSSCLHTTSPFTRRAISPVLLPLLNAIQKRQSSLFYLGCCLLCPPPLRCTEPCCWKWETILPTDISLNFNEIIRETHLQIYIFVSAARMLLH